MRHGVSLHREPLAATGFMAPQFTVTAFAVGTQVKIVRPLRIADA
jgi:hypothetical protein